MSEEPRDPAERLINADYVIEINDEWIARFYQVFKSIDKHIEKLITEQRETNKQLRRIKGDK